VGQPDSSVLRLNDGLFQDATVDTELRFASGGSVNGAAAVVDGVICGGSGYGLQGGRRNKRLLAFEQN